MSLPPRLVWCPTTDELAALAAERLLGALVGLQSHQYMVDLCLTGGRIANQIFARFADLVPGSGLDPARLTLWWGDERFVGLADAERHALGTLGILARTLNLDPSQTHAMPARDGRADPDEAAYAYARELGDTRFDICLLGMGADGHVASLFPGDPRIDSPTASVIGVSDAPVAPAERVSVTLPVINRSRAVWVFVSGAEKAPAVAAALQGDSALPAARVRGSEETHWYVDAEAASLLDRYQCQF